MPSKKSTNQDSRLSSRYQGHYKNIPLFDVYLFGDTNDKPFYNWYDMAIIKYHVITSNIEACVVLFPFHFEYHSGDNS